jgi:hypothetical protein
MKTLRAFSSVVLLVLVAAQAHAESLSVRTWESNLKRSLDAGKTDIAPFFAFEKLEKQVLSHSENADRKNMMAARELYEKGHFAEAIQKYQLIPKGSDYWLEAVEEKGWAYHLQENYAKSLAETKTLLAEPLVGIVGSEPFFLQSLNNLKICDYKAIFETDQTYKETQRARVSAIENLAKTGSSPALDKVIASVDSFPMTFTQIGAEARVLPRLFYRDQEVQSRLMQLKLSERGLALIQQSSNAAKYGKTVELLQKFVTVAKDKLKARMQNLAQVEDKQNQLMLQKLGLIDVETIQRLHADMDLNRKDYSTRKFSKVTADDLVFPDDGYPWVDELDKYEVSTHACPRNIRRKM